jgi:hypothetical protein
MSKTEKTQNRYKVPQRQWRKWSEQERFVFNEIYGSTVKNQAILGHPQMDAISPAFWKTLCWNFAWLASDAAKDFRKREPVLPGGMTVQDITRTGRVTREQKIRAPAMH